MNRRARLWGGLALAPLLLSPAPAQEGADNRPPSPEEALEAAFQRMQAKNEAVRAAYKAKLGREHTAQARQELGRAAAEYLCLGAPASRARTAIRHIGNWSRNAGAWQEQLEIWDAALPRYPAGALRLELLGQRARALVELDRHAEAKQASAEILALGEADQALRSLALGKAFEADLIRLDWGRGAYTASAAERAELSALAERGEQALLAGVGQPGFFRGLVHQVPRLLDQLDEQERIVALVEAAHAKLPADHSDRWILAKKQAEALAALGRAEEARAIVNQLAELDPQRLRSLGGSGARDVERRLALRPGVAAPGFELRDLDGEQAYSLADFRGEVVLLDFWATWCGPCIKAMAEHLAPLHEKYGQRLRIVSIGSPSKDTAAKQKAFCREQGYGWLKLFDAERQALSGYQVTGIPTMVLIDREGKLLVYSRGDMRMAEIEAKLGELLRAPSRD